MTFAEPLALPDQQHYEGSVFPSAFTASKGGLGEAVAWVESNRVQLLELAARDGAVLFRGFPLATAEDFDAFVAAFQLPNFPYDQSLSNAVRVNRTPRVFTANEAPSDVTIFLHHEMAQTPIFPSRLFFFCEQAANEGGATPLCRSDVLFERMRAELPEFAADCESKGLMYRNVMPAFDDPNSGMGRSWQRTFRAGNSAQAEERMRQLGYRWEWLADDALEAWTPILPAVRTLPDGRQVFFNQLIAAFRGWKDERNDPSKAIRFGDDTPLPADQVHRASELADQLTYDLAWRTGDAALVDNFVAMHGRRAFQGERRVLASLIA